MAHIRQSRPDSTQEWGVRLVAALLAPAVPSVLQRPLMAHIQTAVTSSFTDKTAGASSYKTVVISEAAYVRQASPIVAHIRQSPPLRLEAGVGGTPAGWAVGWADWAGPPARMEDLPIASFWGGGLLDYQPPPQHHVLFLMDAECDDKAGTGRGRPVPALGEQLERV